jgi:hypothetical protein
MGWFIAVALLLMAAAIAYLERENMKRWASYSTEEEK